MKKIQYLLFAVLLAEAVLSPAAFSQGSSDSAASGNHAYVQADKAGCVEVNRVAATLDDLYAGTPYTFYFVEAYDAVAAASNDAPGSITPLGETEVAALAADWVKDLTPAIEERSSLSAMEAFGFDLRGSSKESVKKNGAAAFYANSSLLAEELAYLENRYKNQASWMAQGGIAFGRGQVNAFPWGMIEVEDNTFHWEVTDLMVQCAQAQGIFVLGHIIPYAAWDQEAAGNPPIADEYKELVIMTFWWARGDEHWGPIGDLTKYGAFVRAVVERYDGDGVDNMPGLTVPIKYWEVDNEPETNLSPHKGNPDAYRAQLQSAHTAIKAADPSAFVLCGGAMPPDAGTDSRAFWDEVFADGGGAYFDIVSVHYNAEKNEGISASMDRFRDMLDYFNGKTGGKPIWVTETGTYAGTPVDGSGNPLKEQTEQEQASWYLRYFVFGAPRNMTKYFPDFWGEAAPDGKETPISASRLITSDYKVRLFFYTQKVMESRIGGFTAVSEIAHSDTKGQYKFTVNDRSVYVLWDESNSVVDLSGGLGPGNVRKTDIFGNVSIQNSNSVSTTSTPVFVDEGTILYVSSDGNCGDKEPCYKSIQEAVDAAETGSVIWIAQGTYSGSITLNESKTLTLKGKWDASFGSQTGNTTFIKAPSVPKGSLTLLMVTIKP